MNTRILLISMLILIPYSSIIIAQEVVPGCPIFSSMPNIDLGKLMGNWYIHGWIRNTENSGPVRCLNVHWQINQTEVEPFLIDEVVYLTFIETNTTVPEIHTAQVKNRYRLGKWFVNERNIDYDVNIIYTDYNYSLWTQCSLTNGNILIQIFMASRYIDEEFPADLRKQFEALLVGDYNATFVLDSYYEVPQGSELCQNYF